MLILLPPSETKRDGGDKPPLCLGDLAFAGLQRERESAIAALKRVSRGIHASTTALRLGPTQRFEIDRNRALLTSPSLAAIDRYTGVLFDGLEVGSLQPSGREWIERHVAIHSALFGLIGAGDAIPAYRLSHDSRLPDFVLKKHWSKAIAAELAAVDGLVLDLRSEAYVHLGPAPSGSLFLRVVTDSPSGQKRALNHFNKKGKGEFVRALAESGVECDSASSLVEWGRGRGIELELPKPGELQLTV